MAVNWTSIFPPTLRRGSVGPVVAAWQSFLRTVGRTLAADGNFGAGTETETKAWQGATLVPAPAGGSVPFRALAADGIVGPASWAAAWRVAQGRAQADNRAPMAALAGAAQAADAAAGPAADAGGSSSAGAAAPTAPPAPTAEPSMMPLGGFPPTEPSIGPSPASSAPTTVEGGPPAHAADAGHPTPPSRERATHAARWAFVGAAVVGALGVAAALRRFLRE